MSLSEFRPSAIATVTLGILTVSCIALGMWQLQRAEIKQTRETAFEQAAVQEGLPAPDQAEEFLRVSLTGSYDPERHILADNQIFQGRSGVHAYSLFTTSGGEKILVNRGWLTLPPTRTPLPDVITTTDISDISGRLGVMPVPGRQLGQAIDLSRTKWPQLVTYPSVQQISAALDVEVYPLILFLDQKDATGFGDRDWKPVYLTAKKHRAYAIQWFALALVCLIYWVFCGIRRNNES